MFGIIAAMYKKPCWRWLNKDLEAQEGTDGLEAIFPFKSYAAASHAARMALEETNFQRVQIVCQPLDLATAMESVPRAHYTIDDTSNPGQ